MLLAVVCLGRWGLPGRLERGTHRVLFSRGARAAGCAIAPLPQRTMPHLVSCRWPYWVRGPHLLRARGFQGEQRQATAGGHVHMRRGRRRSRPRHPPAPVVHSARDAPGGRRRALPPPSARRSRGAGPARRRLCLAPGRPWRRWAVPGIEACRCRGRPCSFGPGRGNTAPAPQSPIAPPRAIAQRREQPAKHARQPTPRAPGP
jgi:hypothetical protein